MASSLPPVQPTGQTFVSCHRYDPFRRFIVRFLIPVAGILIVSGFFGLNLFLYLAVWRHVSVELRGMVLSMITVMSLMGTCMALGLWVLGWNMKRRYCGTSIHCDDNGLHYRSGKKEIEVPWDSVRIGRVLDLGRMQSAVLETPQGKIHLDPSFVDENGPHPVVRVSFGKEFLVYPDKTRIPHKIRQNELFRLIEQRTGVSRSQPSVER